MNETTKLKIIKELEDVNKVMSQLDLKDIKIYLTLKEKRNTEIWWGAGGSLGAARLYTIINGPSKLVAQRRTGLTQQQVKGQLQELLKSRQPAPPTLQPQRAQPFAQPLGPWPLSSPGPRLVFNRVNRRRDPSKSASLQGTQETYTLAHKENVRFVSEAWQQRLRCHYVLQAAVLLGPSYSPASAFQEAETTRTRDCTWLANTIANKKILHGSLRSVPNTTRQFDIIIEHCRNNAE
ncbi:uncharacterized protein LOC100611487 [Pan troglodytes]|uniref:uncharacterized protein LOC100611487 n=1 Tax=Pan troglodytes TaxID=9598 RepID=UPI0023F51249|nr:uncharacterized protein LOC100611487 [Pan troglodytes]